MLYLRHQGHIAGCGRGLDVRPRQVWVDIEIQLWRSFLDVAEDEVLHGIEADRPQLQRFLHGDMQVINIEGLEQAQHLDILAAAGLDHSRFHQATQGRERGRQIPFNQGGRLIEGVDFTLDQRKIVHRIEDHVFAVVASGMACDDLTTATDHDLSDIAPDPDVTVAVGDWHRVIIRLVAHQRLRTDPSGCLITGIERCRRKVGHRDQITHEALTDRFRLAAQEIRLALAALLSQIVVERVPCRKPWDWHHEVAAGVSDQPFHIALVIALTGSAIAVSKQVVRQKPAEECRPLTRSIRKDLRNQTAVVVVEDRRRHLAEERKRMNVAVNPGFRRRPRIRTHEAGITVRQVHDEEMRLLFDTADHDYRLAEIGLGVPGRMRQRYEHLATAPFALPHVILHDRIAAGEPVLITKPLEHPLRRVPLLAMNLPIAVQPSVYDPGEGIQLRPFDRRRPPISGRDREYHHLSYAVARDVEMPSRFSLAHALSTGQPNLPI